jgi:cell division protease FtsH
MWVRREGEVFLGRDCLTTPRLSSRTLEDLDATVRQLIEMAEARALQILQRRRGNLEAVAGALLERETIIQPELDRLLVSRVGGCRRSATAPRGT